MATPDLAGDVTPEVLGRDDLHDPTRPRRGRSTAAAGREDGDNDGNRRGAGPGHPIMRTVLVLIVKSSGRETHGP